MARWIERVVLAVLVALLGVGGGDWVVWRVRGGPVGEVLVTHLVVAPLKGGREEYYPDRQADEVCSESLLPWKGAGPCWRLRGKPVIFDR